MFKLLYLSLLLLQTMNGQCGKGCLKCVETSATDSTQICKMCDIVAFYYMKSDGTCALSDVKNCITLLHNDSCVFCNAGYFVDSGKCVAIDVQNKITNCEYYDSSQNCQQCAQNFLINTSVSPITCTTITSPLSNCMIQTSTTICSQCNKNYYLDESKVCKIFPTDCLAYSLTKCLSCGSGTIMNFNQYRKNINNFETNAQRDAWWSMLIQIKQNKRSQKSLNLCETTTADHCATFETFDLCSTCTTGYYLASGTKKCTLYPEPIIRNCKIYAFKTATKWQYKCVSCNNLFKLVNDTTCSSISITDCIENDTTASTDVCSRCKDGKILTSNNCTTDRSGTITGCSYYHSSQQKCVTCNSGLLLNTDSSACKTPISNCATHVSFTASTASLICSTCSIGYVKNTDGTACSSGNMNCDIYTNATTCSRCSNQYHASTTCTTKHTDITSCSIYSRNAVNTCLKCSAMKVPLVITQVCKSFTPLAGCTAHNVPVVASDGSVTIACNTCGDSYVINNSTHLCEALSDRSGYVTGCVKIDVTDSDQCLKCSNNKFIATDFSPSPDVQSCRGSADWSSNNCATQNMTKTAWKNQECSVCNAGYYPLETIRCVQTAELKYLNSGSPSDLTTLNNCAQVSSSFACNRCKVGKYLSGTSCVDTCSAAMQYIKPVTSNNDSYVQNNICNSTSNFFVSSQDSNGLLFGMNSAGTVIPYACKNTYYTQRVWNGSYTNLNAWKTSLTASGSVVANFANQTQQVVCPSYASGHRINGTEITSAPSTQAIGENRQIWQMKTVSITANGSTTDKTAFLTITCGWRKEGTISGTGEEMFLNCASTNSSDFLSTRLGGVPAQWSNLFNVHKCANDTNKNKIPVIAFESSTSNPYDLKTYKKFVFDKADVFDDTGALQKNIFCLDIASVATIEAHFGITNNGSTITINKMEHCGLGFLDLRTYTINTEFNNAGYDLTTGTTGRADKEDLVCVACKGGYKADPLKSTSSEIISRGCTPIPNCDLTVTQTMFNNCSQCSNNYVWKADTDGVVSTNECVRVPDALTNCMAYFGANSNTTNFEGSCKVCKKGYFLDKDGYCITVTAPNCTAYQQFNSNHPADVKNYLYEEGADCKTCSTSHILYGNSKFNICTSISTLANKSDKNLTDFVVTATQQRTTANYIDRCQKYSVNGKCSECYTNYILSVDKTLCKNKITTSSSGLKLAFCAVANNGKTDKTCNSCDSGYSLLTNIGCVIGQISNCQTYLTNTAVSRVTCLKCNNEYWLKTLNSDTTCVKGKIPFCNQYNSENDCKECSNSYWLLNDNGGSSGKYCFPKDTTTSCSVARFSTLTDTTPGSTYSYLSATCQTCSGDYTYKIDQRTSKCYDISYPPASSCKTISNDYGFQTSNVNSFQCTECNSSYYLSSADNNYVCKSRDATKNKNCLLLQGSEDKCQTCNANFYLNSNRDSCIAYPTGKHACIAYDNSLKCTACDVDYFLSGDSCVDVTTKVTNCMYYSADNTCTVCKSAYFLVNATTCEIKSTSINCSTFELKDSCKTCPTNYKLVTSNGKNSCLVKTPPTNCSNYDVNTEKCTQCAQYHYVSSTGTCTVVNEDFISGCLVMASSTTCKKCVQGRALSLDKKSCKSGTDLDSRCSEGQIASTPICSMCSAGYQFKDKVCTKNTNATIANGCVDELADKSCLMCISGWSMKSVSTCTDNNPPVVKPKFVGVIIANLMMLMIMMF